MRLTANVRAGSLENGVQQAGHEDQHRVHRLRHGRDCGGPERCGHGRPSGGSAAHPAVCRYVLVFSHPGVSFGFSIVRFGQCGVVHLFVLSPEKVVDSFCVCGIVYYSRYHL